MHICAMKRFKINFSVQISTQYYEWQILKLYCDLRAFHYQAENKHTLIHNFKLEHQLSITLMTKIYVLNNVELQLVFENTTKYQLLYGPTVSINGKLRHLRNVANLLVYISVRGSRRRSHLTQRLWKKASPAPALLVTAIYGVHTRSFAKNAKLLFIIQNIGKLSKHVLTRRFVLEGNKQGKSRTWASATTLNIETPDQFYICADKLSTASLAALLVSVCIGLRWRKTLLTCIWMALKPHVPDRSKQVSPQHAAPRTERAVNMATHKCALTNMPNEHVNASEPALRSRFISVSSRARTWKIHPVHHVTAVPKLRGLTRRHVLSKTQSTVRNELQTRRNVNSRRHRCAYQRR